MEWAENSDELVIQQLNRRQNINKLELANASTGKIQNILTDTDQAWLDPVTDFQWFDEGRSFLWVSDKNGWRQIFLVSRDGRSETLLTPGSYDAISILHADAEDGYVYFIASPDDPQRRYLYRAPLDGSGELERMTPADQPGDHRPSGCDRASRGAVAKRQRAGTGTSGCRAGQPRLGQRSQPGGHRSSGCDRASRGAGARRQRECGDFRATRAIQPR